MTSGVHVYSRTRDELDRTLLMDAELMASENVMIPVRFLFMTPHHPKLTPFRVGEVYTGLAGQRRIKLVDDCGRVWHYDKDQVVWAGCARDAGRGLDR